MNEEEKEPMAEQTAEPGAAIPATPEAESDATDQEVEDSLSRLLEEAEQRGYLRARNEIARAAMKKPSLWENSRRTEAQQSAPQKAPDEEQSLTSDFLTRLRPCVWD